MSLLRPRSRLLSTFSPRHRRAIRHLVTPFAPYLLCDYYLSTEIHSWGVRSLNRRAKSLRLHAGRVRENAIVYCQSDLVDEFVERYLTRIRHPFVLITGKYRLPPLEPGPATEALLRSDTVRTWFSQNLPLEHDKCRPFPYGINHVAAADVLDAMRRTPVERQNAIYYGYVGVHGHLTPSVRDDRLCLGERMDGKVALPDYLANLRSHRFVASPQGDRPDTFRHWEAVALGCVPVSNLPRWPFEPLFGRSMLFLDAMRDILTLDVTTLDCPPPDGRIVELAHWGRAVRGAATESME